MTDANPIYAAESNVISHAAAGLSPEERSEAHRYGTISLNCTLADLAIDVVFLALMAFVFAGPIDAWLTRLRALSGTPSMLRLLALFGVVTLLHICVSLPLSFYSGYIVEHQFALSNQSLGRWITNWLKRTGLAVVFGGAMFAGLFWII
ncbi:MAG TPA: hypothetical protein VGJ04_06610, partial [Pirellulales bacterium]